MPSCLFLNASRVSEVVAEYGTPELVSLAPRPLFKSVIWGTLAGLLAGLTMLCTMGSLRLFFGWPTPIELIFDRVFGITWWFVGDGKKVSRDISARRKYMSEVKEVRK